MPAPKDTLIANDLVLDAKAILSDNNHNSKYHIPAKGLYPHQWLWDSCFIAIGLSNYDVEAAKTEILSLLRGQWSNGMLPHMIISSSDKHGRDGQIWNSWLSPFAPDKVSTSGLTQPPIIAQAIVSIGEKMSKAERRTWYQNVYPALLAYHKWLYHDRDPHHEGLVLLIHPWESGLDNSPPWMSELHKHKLGWVLSAVNTLHLDRFAQIFRRDVHFVPASQRESTRDALALYGMQRRFKRKAYDINAILDHAVLAIEDVGYNAMLIRANEHLHGIAQTIGRKLPETLRAQMRMTEDAMEQLWDEHTTQYYSRNFTTHETIKISSIASLLPLYGGSISKERAAELVKHIENSKVYGAKFLVPSVPLNSNWYDELGYWQGPTWINTNWMIIQGLEHYGYNKLATKVREASIAAVKKSGFYEYFSAKNGEPAGIPHFSWTAALIIDLLS
jgi:hypothetical protein